jgi:hypothetical protein
MVTVGAAGRAPGLDLGSFRSQAAQTVRDLSYDRVTGANDGEDHRMRRTLALTFTLALTGVLAAPATGSAATIAVTSNADGGPGTLRAAIAASNAGDTITIPAITITLTSGQLTIPHSLTITGTGAGATTVSGNNLSRVFAAGNGQVQISALTITAGTGKATAASASGDGGAVLINGGVSATLTLSDLVVSDSSVTNSSDGGESPTTAAP